MEKQNLRIIFFLLLVHLFNAYGIVFAQDRMEWWRDDKFGMFIHWGIYSVLGRGEWVMVTELIQNYPVSNIWFDADYQIGYSDQDAINLYNLCLYLNPDIIVNNRVNHDLPNAGDYLTPEQEVPETPPERDWETCMTINSNWGFHQYDHNWKTSESLIHTLLEINSKGGNLLLNIGPTADGVIPSQV